MAQNWTTQDMIDLTGKIIIVTGANSGIGFYETMEFARKGAKVIMACRNLEKAKQAKSEVMAEIPNAKIDVIRLDLQSLDSIELFAKEFKNKSNQLDILVNNAGIMRVPYRKTKDGFESQIGTNHLGHFALTAQLFELIKNTEDSRVVNVSSLAHKSGIMDFDNFLYEGGKEYTKGGAYSRSKLANLHFTYELTRRLKSAKINSIALAAHPGISNTNLFTRAYGRFSFIIRFFQSFILQSSEMGALPVIRAAVDPDAQGGDYYGPNGKKETKGYPIKVQSSAESHNLEDAKKLWEISEKLTKIQFTI